MTNYTMDYHINEFGLIDLYVGYSDNINTFVYQKDK